jgi:hypothetical protein
MHPTNHHIRRPAVAIVFACALVAGPATAAARAADHAQAGAPSVIPTSNQNARWPREPASGPLPAVTPAATPAPISGQAHDGTPASVAAGLGLLGACTAFATGVHLRPRRRVTA